MDQGKAQGQTGGASKVCIICGEDCSRRPRLKDPHGRYTCEACVKTRQAVPAAKPAPAIVDDDAPLELLEEPSSSSRNQGPCANCGQILPPAVAICLRCGYNRETQQMVRTSMEQLSGDPSTGLKKRACTKCKYDMTGLQSARCRECGTVNVKPDRKELSRREAKRQRFWMWVAPLIMIVVGCGLMGGLNFSRSGVEGLIAYAITFGISLAIGLFVYFAASIMWIGFDEPLPVTALRLAGVYALADIGFSLVGMIPRFGMVGFAIWIVPMMIYVGLLVKVMDIDTEDAVIVAAITTVARIFVVIAVIGMLMG